MATSRSYTPDGAVAAAAFQKQGSSSGERQQAMANSTKSQKLNQVVQNFFMKAAQIVIQARQPVAPLYARGSTTKRVNKWFNIETVDTDAFRDDLRLWKTVDMSASSFTYTPPLIIDVVLLTRDLTPNQTLVLLGENGQRWDVENGGGRRKLASSEIVLERWRVDWEPPTTLDVPELPVTYKKSIVVFRSLFTLTRLLPTWKLRKKLAKSKLTGNALKVVCRVDPDQRAHAEARVPLSVSIVPGRVSSTERHEFPRIETAAGRFRTFVEYRTECDFRVDDSEALLSSQFLTSDEGVVDRTQFSAPSDLTRRSARPGTSLNSLQQVVHSPGPHSSLPVDGRASSNSSGYNRLDRRPSSALIQPFKTPSLSVSPAVEPYLVSPHNLPRTPSSVSIDRIHARGASYQQAPRVQSSLGDSTGFSLSGSPRNPAQPPQLIKRYSSSFGQRSGSFSSRRRASQASESAVHTDSAGSRASSRSPSTLLYQVEDDDLGDFVKLLDARKPLTGSHFRDDGSSVSKILSDSMVQRSRSELSRYQRLKETHATVADSLLQSTLIKKTSISPVAQTTRSGNHEEGHSISFGKSVSAHQPSIPSRLSESSVISRSSSVHAAPATGIAQDIHTPASTAASIIGLPGNHRAMDIPRPAPPSPPPRQRSNSCSARSQTLLHGFQTETKMSTSLGSVTSYTTGSRAEGPSKGKATNCISSVGPVESPACVPSHASQGVSFDRNRSGVLASSARIPTDSHIDNFGQLDSRDHRPDVPDCTRAHGALPLDDDDLFFAMSDIHLKNN